MRGAESLIALRRKGYRPELGAIVMLHTGKWKPNDGENQGGAACLDVDAGEPIDRIDLRCLIGLRVAVFGKDDARVSEFVAAAAKAGAESVIGLQFKTLDGQTFERWIASHNPWTEPVNPWPN